MIIEGIECSNDPVLFTGIEPGEMYMAKRNTGWKLLTCKIWNKKDNFVVPEEWPAYYYDGHECFKVLEN